LLTNDTKELPDTLEHLRMTKMIQSIDQSNSDKQFMAMALQLAKDRMPAG